MFLLRGALSLEAEIPPQVSTAGCHTSCLQLSEYVSSGGFGRGSEPSEIVKRGVRGC